MISFKTHSNSGTKEKELLGCIPSWCVHDLGVRRPPPNTHTCSFACILLEDKTKQKEPRRIRVVQPILFIYIYLFIFYILQLGFFNEVDPLVENKPTVHSKNTGIKINRYLCQHRYRFIFIPVLLGWIKSIINRYLRLPIGTG